QKTGHFLDQRENRAAAAAFAPGRRVLDCFCYTGTFGLAAALAGAASVLGVDLDESALRVAARNAALNGVEERCRFVAANAFDFLRAAVEEGREYDLVVLDPPAFTKSRFRVEEALRGYKEINLRAIRLLSPGGILVTCSCSHHVSFPLFQEVVGAAAADAGRDLRLIARRGHPADHPVLIGVPETEYLKCLILEALP
ncbi:MAG: class I SAM-dependent methyltransferase, partial [Firmicutes bacterium]|nr:class I SAM-dependent methyltransferase [Bacillota bacterium]